MKNVLLAGMLLFAGFAGAKEIKLLTIGNSFADNAARWLPQIVQSAGDELVLRKANLGGHSLEQHWNYVEQGKSPYYGGKKNLKDLLTEQKWDYVTIQQVSHKSFQHQTFHPYAEKLIAYIREYAPSAEILIHETWAYRDDHRWFTGNGGDDLPSSHDDMYAKVIDSYKLFQKETGFRMIPSGEALEAARSFPGWGKLVTDTEFDPKTAVKPELPKTEKFALHTGWYWGGDGKLRRDCIHANATGEYLIGCLWYEFLFKKSCMLVTFVPPKVSSDDALVMRKIAHETLAK